MTELSPQAQAVLDVFWEGLHCGDDWRREFEKRVAAVLRAAADQVVPEEPHPGESQFWDDEAKQEWQNNQHFRKQLIAIAAELEAEGPMDDELDG